MNLTSIAQNFKDWANGEPMGIGENTYKVLMIGDYVEHPFEVSKKVWEMSGKKAAANGGVMRTSIVGLFPKAVEECAVNICRLTHYDPRCVGSCVIVSELIHSLVYNEKRLSYHQIVDMGMQGLLKRDSFQLSGLVEMQTPMLPLLALSLVQNLALTRFHKNILTG